ncbi:hypothetical protein, partial [uncultured Aquimarina sp.]|uniref:hypothetical protein n=1 Tax=uncultured Aquimarina sp. TaxID=575652 RepID=UPI0026105F94
MKKKLLLSVLFFCSFSVTIGASIDHKKTTISLEGNSSVVSLFSSLDLEASPIDAYGIAKKINELSYYAPTTPITPGTATIFTGTNFLLEPSAVALSATQFVIAYRSSTSGTPGEAIVGTLSGNSISFGSSTSFATTVNATHTAISKISATQFIIAFEDERGASDIGEMRIGTVSGSAISFGSSFDFATGDTDALEMIALSGTSHIVVYRDVEDSNKGKAKVVTVSGATLSFGAELEFLSDATVWTGLDALSSNTFVVGYQTITTGVEGGAIVGSVSGTTITFGSANIFETNCVQVDIVAISADKFVVAYDDNDDGNGYVQVGSISGTTITGYGTRQQITTNINGIRVAPSTADKFIIMYTPSSGTDPTYAKEGEVIGTDITLSAQATIHNGNSDNGAMEVLEIDDGKHIYIYQDESNGNVGKAIYGEASLVTNTAPIATAPSAPTVLEDATNIALANNIQVTDTDGDDQTLTFTTTGGTVALGTTGVTFGGGGNGSASFTASGTLAAINTALDAATFTPSADLNGTNAGTISFTTNDGNDTSSPASVTFNITAVNDEPSFTAGANEGINEDAGAQTVNGWATAIDDGDSDAT